jgi:hypothetical protein
MSTESLLAEIARRGVIADAAAATAYGQAAARLLTLGASAASTATAASAGATDADTVALVASLYTEVTRQRQAPDDVAAAAADYLPDAAVARALAAELAPVAAALARTHASFFADLSHVVAVSSTVQHHVRDLSVRGAAAAERAPRSVANFVFALDVAPRGVLLASSGAAAEAEAPGAARVAFQCTGEQAQELAATLRAAAAALARAEARSATG